MGEGYSLTPREAVALGVPCILADHTVHCVLGGIPSIRKVPATTCVKAYFSGNEHCGCYHQCSVDAVCEAMRDMRAHYAVYLEQAQKSRSIAREFLRRHLAPLFVTIIRPETLRLGKVNMVEPGQLITNDKKLYNKYLGIRRLVKKQRRS